MTSALRFRDHEDFHRAAWQMALLGGVAGLLATLSLSGLSGAWAAAMWPLGAAIGALAPAVRRRPAAAVTVGLLALGGGALMALSGLRTEWTVLALALPYATALAWGMSGRRLLVALGVGAVVALAARHAAVSVATTHALAAWPAWAVGAMAGAVFAFVSVVALLPRHLIVERDPVASGYAALAPRLDGEVRELIDRGHALWQKTSGSLAPDDVNRITLQGGVLRLLSVARRWTEVEAERADEMSASIGERIAVLDGRIEATDDVVVLRQYREAREALREQRRYADGIGRNRERVLARLHNYLAAMERLRLAVINLQSSNASREAVDVQPLLADLEDLGADIDSCAEALVEVETA